MSVGIFYGSCGGVTRGVAEKLAEKLEDSELIDMEEDYDDVDQMLEFDCLLFGCSTWGQGELQRDWVDPFLNFDDYDFSGKKIALFGAGDAKTHGEHFVSALGKLYHKMTERGATVVGFIPTDGFDFEYSEAVIDGKFCGLPIDDVNQADLTETRVNEWADILKREFGL
jgi:flavodoxin I